MPHRVGLTRDLLVLRALIEAGQPSTVPELAKRAGVGEISVRRALATLRAVGFPLTIEEDPTVRGKGAGRGRKLYSLPPVRWRFRKPRA